MQHSYEEESSMFLLSKIHLIANNGVPRKWGISLMEAELRVVCVTSIVLCLLTVPIASCSKVDMDIEGVWYRSVEDLDVLLSFEKETFWLRVGSGSRKVDGRYNIEGETIRLIDEDCGDAEGIYRLTESGGRVTFTLIEDVCNGRRFVLQGEWEQKE
jgi:hypothetical protein